MRSRDTQHSDSRITTGQVVRYVALPGIIPRINELFVGSFSYVAFLMGQIYAMVRLLPAEHPYLNPQNMGRFGLRQVIAEAGKNLVFSTRHFDQLFIFFALLIGLILLVLQVGILFYSLVIGVAEAASPPSILFLTPDPIGGEVTDIAFLLLDHVFGVPELFCTQGDMCSDVLSGGPTPFHLALQDLFQFYSLAVMMVAVLIFLYFMVVVAVETAQTGTPFGQRFQNVFVPIRLVVAIGLLIPINYGYSTGQYIAFYAAKWGSGFATNGWNAYNDAIFEAGVQNPTGEQETLIPKPASPSVAAIAYSMSLIHACAHAYQRIYSETKPTPSITPDAYDVQPYLINAGESIPLPDDFEEAVKFTDHADIRMRFGIHDEIENTQWEGAVEPTCGEIRIAVHSAGLIEEGEDPVYDDPLMALTAHHYTGIFSAWQSDYNSYEMGQRMVEINVRRSENQIEDACEYGADNSGADKEGNPYLAKSKPACYTDNPNGAIRSDIISLYQSTLNVAIEQSWEEMAKTAPFDLRDEVRDRGWGGAGIWYNRIAAVNGPFISSVVDVPQLSKYPLAMENTRKAVRAASSDVGPEDEFTPVVPNGPDQYRTIQLEGGRNEVDMARALSTVHKFWLNDGAGDVDSSKVITGNPIKSIITMMFGVEGLLNIRHENAYAHPMAQLVALGKSFVESGVRNLAGSSVSAFMGGLPVIFQKGLASFAGGIGSFLNTTAFLFLTAGFILFYIIPFLPFVYVFFAVGGWVKGLFESMVGIPLWALAHMRLDGDGLPPQAAENGYFLIMDVFVRPILVVVGLIAAITMFAVQVRVLNFTWDLVLVNAGGFNVELNSGTVMGDDFRRSYIDQFFFTIVYVIIVYLMANGSFKLIDSIPKSILRWAGSGISSFGDINEDPKGIQQYAAMGGITVGRQIVGGVEGLAKGTGGALNTFLGGDEPPAAKQGQTAAEKATSDAVNKAAAGANKTPTPKATTDLPVNKTTTPTTTPKQDPKKPN